MYVYVYWCTACNKRRQLETCIIEKYILIAGEIIEIKKRDKSKKSGVRSNQIICNQFLLQLVDHLIAHFLSAAKDRMRDGRLNYSTVK